MGYLDNVGKRIRSLRGNISIDDISHLPKFEYLNKTAKSVKVKVNNARSSAVVNRARMNKKIEIKCLMTKSNL